MVPLKPVRCSTAVKELVEIAGRVARGLSVTQPNGSGAGHCGGEGSAPATRSQLHRAVSPITAPLREAAAICYSGSQWGLRVAKSIGSPITLLGVMVNVFALYVTLPTNPATMCTGPLPVSEK